VPSDKADSVDIHITVPSDLIVASNGNLISETINGSDKTYHWSERYPITTYLVSVAIHPYTVYSDWYVYSPTDSMEVQYYVFPDKYEAMQSVYGMTVEMIEVFSSLFGEYPFINEKYGHAHFLWGGGMEHQTCSSLYYAIAHEYLNVHELAHMWWGDMITCDSFHHIWLNEGFAVYSEALWSQEKYGVAKYHQDMENTKYFGGGTIFVPNPDDFSRIFNVGLSYNKASWVPHMLRHIVGDATFYDILTTYYADTRYQYGTATTEEFRDLCEDVAGIDLDWFFHQWIYEEYYPQYEYNWSSAPNGGLYDVSLTIDQVQTNYIFKMPIDVTVTTTAGDTTFVVWDSLATQAFTLTVDSPPIQVALDKDDWILCTIEEPVIDPTFHRGILVVNGVDFDTYGSAIWSAYADSAFWGSYDMSFWDCFEETGSGYPANVPTPLGHGPIPADTLKEFSTVVWVGNNYNGDLPKWTDTAIQSYLQAGGNVLLMSRMGRDFVDEDLRSYLGITWREFPENTLNNCVATYPGLVDMTLAGGTQTYCAVFDTSLATSESTLLFKETASFSTHRGLGAIRIPVGGGTDREDGGRFAFLSGRPYRWNHDALRANVEFMLGSLLNEPYVPTGIEPPATPKAALRLEQNHPNPFNPETTIRYTVPTGGLVDMKIYDVSGRLVRTLVSRELPAGEHSVLWDGKNTGGESVASGVYFYRMIAGGQAVTKKMVMLR
jgi:hypothetical protein